MIAYDGSGHSLVLTDGAELLVHDGPSEGPRWRRTLGAPIVAVGATPTTIVAVDGAGEVGWFAPERESLQASASAGEPVRAAAVSLEGHVLVATSSGARVLTPGGPGPRIAWPGASAVAWAPDGRMLVGGDDGRIGELSRDGTHLYAAQLEGGVVAAAHDAQGFWVVATARKLLRFAGGELHHLTSAPPDLPVRAVACAGDGGMIAMALGDAVMIVIDWPQRDTVGQLIYADRKVEGLAFGPAPFLAVALDGGDGNKLNMRTGALHRTDPHEGRPLRRWIVQKSVSAPKSAPAPVPAPAPAPAAASAPERAAFSPPAAPAAAPQPGAGMIMVVLAVTLAVIGLIAALVL